MSDPATVVGEAPTASEAPAIRHTALIEAHRRLEAKLTGFGGWEMPLAYPTGTVAEHLACRRDAVIFDVSHLGTVRVVGPQAFDRLQETLSNDLRKVHVGQAQYTHLLDDADGSVVDDIIVWWVGRRDLRRHAQCLQHPPRGRPPWVGPTPPRSGACSPSKGPGPVSAWRRIAPDAAAVPRFGVTSFVRHTTTCMAAGTGYTGEDGVECVVPADVAEAFWDAVLAAGVQPAGLGARDTLRLEAALPLHGHELGPGITPLQAGLGWVVGWDKSSFRGRQALLAERDRGVSRRLAGLATEGRQPPREGGIVLQDGRRVGSVTSGNFSPVLGHGIALALLEPTVTDTGTVVEVEQRGRRLTAVVTETPFVPAGRRHARSSRQ